MRCASARFILASSAAVPTGAATRRTLQPGGFEKQALVDPTRSVDVVTRAERDGTDTAFLVDEALDEASRRRVFAGARLEYESTAIGAALRNRAKVGGERFRKAEFYVASVETPKVLVDGSSNLFDALERAIRGAHAAGGVPSAAPEQLHAMVTSGGGFPAAPWWVEDKFLQAWRSTDARAGHVAARAAALLHRVVCAVLAEVYAKDAAFVGARVGLVYMQTLRANFSVALRTKSGLLLFNVRALEQQLRFGGDGGGLSEPH